MPIAPIVGKLRKRFFVDLTCSTAMAVTAGYAYWYGIHLKALENQENYYIKLEKEKLQSANSA